jgi:TonB family protein
VDNVLGFREVSSNLAAQGIESSELAIDLILHDIAERALQVTGATGAAIAIERDGSLVCRGAAGSTAPDLGAKINVQSGLSGGCVREGKLQWCSDTDRDSRVDAEACRILGVRSIVVLPVLIANRVVGVFEIFSSYPDSFRDRDVKALQEMARWVQDAVAGTVPPPEQAETLFESPTKQAAELAQTIRRETASFEQSAQLLARRDQTTRILRGVAIGLAALLCVLLVLRWTRNAPATTAQAGSGVNRSTPMARDGNPVSAQPVADTGLANVIPKPPSGRRKGPTKNVSLILKDTISSGRGEPSSAAETNERAPQSTGDQSSSRAADQVKTTPANDQAPPPIPATELASASPGALRGLPGGLNAMVSPPAVTVPEPVVSKGVEEGRLIHSVQPRYPVDAMQRRIEGMVVLHAIIGKDGTMHDLKSVRGDRLLLQAAMEAVRQWRYKPYMLNGIPVDMPIDITINFNLPK